MTFLVVHWAVLVSAFAILWFLALFCLFPIGLGEVDKETGAPANPRLLLKMGWATVIAIAGFVAFYTLIFTHIIDL